MLTLPLSILRIIYAFGKTIRKLQATFTCFIFKCKFLLFLIMLEVQLKTQCQFCCANSVNCVLCWDDPMVLHIYQCSVKLSISTHTYILKWNCIFRLSMQFIHWATIIETVIAITGKICSFSYGHKQNQKQVISRPWGFYSWLLYPLITFPVFLWIKHTFICCLQIYKRRAWYWSQLEYFCHWPTMQSTSSSISSVAGPSGRKQRPYFW